MKIRPILRFTDYLIHYTAIKEPYLRLVVSWISPIILREANDVNDILQIVQSIEKYIKHRRKENRNWYIHYTYTWSTQSRMFTRRSLLYMLKLLRSKILNLRQEAYKAWLREFEESYIKLLNISTMLRERIAEFSKLLDQKLHIKEGIRVYGVNLKVKPYRAIPCKILVPLEDEQNSIVTIIMEEIVKLMLERVKIIKFDVITHPTLTRLVEEKLNQYWTTLDRKRRKELNLLVYELKLTGFRIRGPRKLLRLASHYSVIRNISKKITRYLLGGKCRIVALGDLFKDEIDKLDFEEALNQYLSYIKQPHVYVE